MGKKKAKEGGEDLYNMMTLEEVRQREVKYTQRVEALKACMNYLEDILKDLERLNEENRLRENWEAYLRCDGLPKPYLPPDIRLFFVRLRYFEAEEIEKNIDWTLSVDNRSVLTQNIFRTDKTRDTVKAEKLPDYGGEYNRRIDLALQVLKAIEYYLVDDKMVAKAKKRILEDITEQKRAVHNEIFAFLDRYSYRVLTSEDAYMNDIDARTADYFYAGNNFQLHIWTIKNVPIIFEFLEEPLMVANLHCLKAKICLPFAVLQDNLTIRAIHFEFDPFSEFAKSFEQKITINIDDLNAGITDLRDCLANEWKMQLELQLETRDMMVQKRLEYEEKKRQFEEEEAQRAKEEKGGKADEKKKKYKPIKLPKEPPMVAENEVPDTWRDFLKKETQEFEDFLNKIYHPDILNLQPHEVNLKKYFMLGGIYQFDFVGKARHFDFNFNSFNMTWHENDGKLLLKNNIKIKPPVVTQQRAPDTAQPQRKSDAEIEEEVFDPHLSPWFVIQLELPEFLCLWGNPLPCQYEAEAIGYIEEEKVEVAATPSQTKSKKAQQAANQALHAAVADKMAHSADRQSVISFVRGSVHSLMATAERQGSMVRMPTSAALHADDEALELGVEDFDLNFPLTKSQIRQLERYCLPRIVSSYKFPSEFRAEAREASAKAKSAGGTLVRQKHTQAADDEVGAAAAAGDAAAAVGGWDLEQEKPEGTFTTLLQYDPERLFPLFPELEDLNILGDFGIGGRQPRTFADLIKRLDHIKLYYQTRHMRTVKLPYFMPNMKILQAKVTKKKEKVLPEDSMLLERGRRSSRGAISAHASLGSVSIRKDSARKSTMTPRVSATALADDGEEGGDEDEGEGEGEGVEALAVADEQAIVDTRKTYKFSRWTTQHIKHFQFEREKRKLTIWTDRLGVFGLAYKRYEHFPFRYWTLEPSEENPENEVVFTLETQFVKVVLFVTGDGVRGYVTDLQKKFVRNRPMFLVIEEPLKDFRELRKRFREKNLNIFTERDASFYIENGYFSQKHLATELHTYCCMCTHALLMRFLYSDWNRLASRRDLILRLVHHKESEEYMCTVRVKPEEATFVTIKELCSDDLNVFNLEYTLTWRNIDFYADVHHLITSMYPSAPEQRVKDPHLIYFLKAILWEIRPLSFS